MTQATKKKSSAARAKEKANSPAKRKEPRGRPARHDTRNLTGATADDPLLTIQIPDSLKILTSVWDDLALVAKERNWHRSVLVREIIVAWVRDWKQKRAAREKDEKKGEQEDAGKAAST